jgi:hypothetical protein
VASGQVRRAASVALALVALLHAQRVGAQSSPEPAPPAEAPAEAAVPAAPAPAAPAPAPPVEEVQVHGRKGTKSGQTTFGGQEVRQVPGAFGDAFRVMEALPGVTPLVSGLPFFFVRGAPPGNNGYYIDGIRIPLLYHVGAGPSVIHPGLVERVDFYPGGYPARYGRFAGGILSGETKRPAEEVHGEGNVRLFDAGALLEAPFAEGRGSILVAGRYSYTAALISLAAPDAVLEYWDYQARATYNVGSKDQIGVFAFGSYDFFGEKRPSGETRTAFATQFHRIDARWDHQLPDHGKMRTAVTIGSDATGTEELAGVRDRMISGRVYIEQPVGKDVTLRGGADITLDHYDLDVPATSRQERDTSDSLYPPRNDLVMGAHLDAVIQAADRWEVTPGIRVDMFESVRNLANVPISEQKLAGNGAIPSVDPRLLSRLRLAKRVTLVSTFGISHQPPAFFVPVPGLQLGRLTAGLQTSIQASQGVEVALPWAFTFVPTFFYHRYLGLTDFATTCGVTDNSNSDNNGEDCIDKRVSGRTIGFEMLLRRSLTQKLTGWISYTLSRTTRGTTLAAYDLSSVVGIESPRQKSVSYAEVAGDFDRTHVLNVIGAYDLGAGWRAGARFYYYTGRPYSRRVFGYTIPPFNEERFPDFYRIDARIEKAWRIGTKGRIAVVFEWLNVTLRKEATSVNCGSRGSSFQDALTASDCKFEEIGPVTIPSLGVEGAF